MHDFQFIIPVLRGLGSLPNLKEMIVHFNHNGQQQWGPHQVEFRQLKDFFKEIVVHCSNILSLEIKEDEAFGDIFDYHMYWIPSLANLEKLTFSDVLAGGSDYKMFYENPMIKLKSLKLDRSAGMFEDDNFLINLHKTFPSLETFEYIGNDEYVNTYTWNRNILPDILESLGKVKDLSISEFILVFGCEKQFEERIRSEFEEEEEKC